MKLDKFLVAAVCALAAALITACSDDAKCHDAIPNVDKLEAITQMDFDDSEFDAIDKLSDLSFEMNSMAYKNEQTVFGTNISGNSVFSPVSTLVSLTMLANGMDSPVGDNIAKRIGFDDINSLNKFVNKTLRYLQGKPDGTALFTNAVWMHNAYTPSQNFANALSKNFAAPVASLDFDDKGTVDLINAWCCDFTEGLIPSIVDNLDADNPIIATNALYYASKWYEQFDKEKTTIDPFYGSERTSDIAMMHTKNNGYASDDEAEMITLGLKHHNCALYVVIGKENSSWLPQSITKEQFNSLLKSMKYYYEVTLSLPRFKAATTANFASVLSAMGIPGSDYTMAAAGLPESKYFNMIDVKQNASIEIDEEGAKGAVVTVTKPLTTAGTPVEYIPVEVIVNRPFFFAIRDNDSGAIILMGCVNNL